jgi:hypothetical protein
MCGCQTPEDLAAGLRRLDGADHYRLQRAQEIILKRGTAVRDLFGEAVKRAYSAARNSTEGCCRSDEGLVDCLIRIMRLL